jgi:hypothetical protein
VVISARFPGKCRVCGEGIPAGATVEWERGSGAAHVTCSGTSALKPAPVPGPPQADWLAGVKWVGLDTDAPASAPVPERPAGEPAARHGAAEPGPRVRIVIRPWLARERGLGRALDGVIVRETRSAIQFTGTTATKGLVECQVCGRELTNGMSRRLGVGPVCLEKFIGQQLAHLRMASFEGLTDEEVQAVVDALEARRVDAAWFPKSQLVGVWLLGADGEPGEAYEF